VYARAHGGGTATGPRHGRAAASSEAVGPPPTHYMMWAALLLCTAAGLLAPTTAASSAPPLPPKPPPSSTEPASAATPHLSGDPKWLTRLHTRPGHTKQLNKDNFDKWVTKAVHEKKTVIVRWISTDDDADCSQIAQRHEPSDGTDAVKKEDQCKVLAQSSQQWNQVAEEYRDSDNVVFGDIVLSDWKSLVKEVQSARIDLEQKQQAAETSDEAEEMVPSLRHKYNDQKSGVTEVHLRF
jgi:hypothetical protein